MGLELASSMARTAAKHATVPVSFHLDHGKDFETIKRVIDYEGHTSIMIDASHLDFEENIDLTTKVVNIAHAAGIPVEAELGSIAGVEDFVSVEDYEASMTDPKQAVEFVERTGCDILAIAIGTKHGAFKFEGETKLDIHRLRAIDSELNLKIPLVLHGASHVDQETVRLAEKYGADLNGAMGVSNEALKEAITAGIDKVNIDTDLRIAFTAGVREELKKNPEVFDPRKILDPAAKMIQAVAVEKMRIMGSSGKADLVKL